MRHNPVNLSICNQKGGVGKSTFTVLLASWLHSKMERNNGLSLAQLPKILATFSMTILREKISRKNVDSARYFLCEMK